MDPIKEKILERIKKCLDLANGRGATDVESTLAREKAGEMMEKYNISIIEVQNMGEIDKAIIEIEVDGTGKRVRKWETTLANAIGRTFDCRVIYDPFFNDKWTISFVGYMSDVETTLYFYKYLTRYVGVSASRKYRKQVEQKSYAYGMVGILNQRLHDLYKGIEKVRAENPNTMALVVVKKGAVSKKFEELHPHRRSARSEHFRTDMGAYNTGREDGKHVPLSRPVGMGKSPAGQIS